MQNNTRVPYITAHDSTQLYSSVCRMQKPMDRTLNGRDLIDSHLLQDQRTQRVLKR